MDAAIEVLRRNAGSEATMAEILAVAGLSTRAFYRHFATKEDLICALYQRDAESFGAHLRRRVEQAGSPTDALVIWIDEVLSLTFDRYRRERMAAFRSPMVTRIVAGSNAQTLGTKLVIQPLQEVLIRGREAGVFPLTSPELDVHTIYALTWEVVSWVRSAESPRLGRRDALAHVLRFTLPALGASLPQACSTKNS